MLTAAVASQANVPHVRPRGLRVLTWLSVLVASALTLSGTYGEHWGFGNLGQAAPDVVRVGDPSPSFSAQLLDGSTLSSDALRGRVVVLNFWATWCGPCRVEMPELERYSQDMAGSVTIVGVDMQEPHADVATFVARGGFTYPIALDDGPLSFPYRVTVLPTSVIIDRSGVVRARVSGPMTRDLLGRRVGPLL